MFASSPRTNTDLQRAVKSGEFREDLFYRLNVINIHLPPLRNRREDILPLAQHFIRKYSAGERAAASTRSWRRRS
jgi:transcriptional regulator with PAS, ATPase and Fis domain